jgi:hypothetical protein
MKLTIIVDIDRLGVPKHIARRILLEYLPEVITSEGYTIELRSVEVK